MNLSVLAGDLVDAKTDALCTSPNPRLSLMMGTGASVRERGGFEVLRACEAIVASNGVLPPGSAHLTPAGALPHRVLIHCVAQYRSIAMPVFGSGHARVRFDVAVTAIAAALLRTSTTPLDIVIAVNDVARAEEAAAILQRTTPTAGSRNAHCTGRGTSREHVGERGFLSTLELRKVYEVLDDATAVSRNYVRVIDESGEDYLYPQSWFVPVSVPANVEDRLHELAAR